MCSLTSERDYCVLSGFHTSNEQAERAWLKISEDTWNLLHPTCLNRGGSRPLAATIGTILPWGSSGGRSFLLVCALSPHFYCRKVFPSLVNLNQSWSSSQEPDVLMIDQTSGIIRKALSRVGLQYWATCISTYLICHTGGYVEVTFCFRLFGAREASGGTLRF